MNNDLEQFSEERLIEIAGGGFKSTAKFDEQMALARIALSVKQANPVGYATRDENYDWHIDFCGEAHCLSQGDSLYTTPQPAHTEVNSPVIPDGWKLVPIEPTEAMCDVKRVGVDVFVGEAEGEEPYSIDGDSAEKVYRSMLAAAPKPESE